jgi:hypothetical protein
MTYPRAERKHDDGVETNQTQKDATMSSHMPSVPPASRSNKGPKDDTKPTQDTSIKHPEPQNIAEQGETANIKQNTTNKGYFHARRVK